MRLRHFALAACATLLITGVALANKSLEDRVAQAKAAYRSAPSPATLAAVEEAVADLEAATKRDTPRSASRATVTESEPNGTSGTADAMTSNVDRGTGDLSPAGDRDFWSVSGAAVGDLLFVLLDSGASTTGTDTEMSVFETDGTTLIEFDDDSGDGLGSAVADIVPTAGSIFAELNEFGDNGTITPYNLFMAVVAPGSAVAESEPNDTSATAEAMPGTVVTGDLGDATDDFFFFGATAGDRIGAVCNNDPDDDASFADTEMTLLSTDGSTTLASEAPFSVTGQNAVAGTATASGLHFLSIADGGSGADTDYSCVVWVVDAPVPVELQGFSIE